MKTLNQFRSQINEVLKASDPIEKWIDDFVHSKNPKFAGKSTKERIEMAKGAYYGAQKNESASISQNTESKVEMEEDHLVHVTDGSGYDDTPHPKDIEHIKTGAMHTGGEWHGHSDKGAFFKFKSKEDAEHFKRHVDKCPHKSCYADHVNEAVEYKGIGTDVVDKKKKLNPQPNFTTDKKQVKDFKEEAEQIDELDKKTIGSYAKKATKDLKWQQTMRPFDAKRISNREKGIDRAIDKLTKEEAEQIDESSLHRKHFQMVADLIRGHESAEKRKELAHHHAEIFKKENPRFDHAKFMKAAGVNEEIQVEGKVYDPFTKKMVATKPIKVQADGGATKNGVPVETGPSKYKQGLKEEQINEISWDDAYDHGFMGHKPASDSENYKKAYEKGALDSKVASAMRKTEVPKKIGEEVQIDEVSKSTLMRYIPKASRDVADHVAMAKERQVTMAHATHAGNYDMAKKESGKSQISFKKAMQRIKGIDTATKKLGTQKEEVEHVDEAAHVYDTKTNKVHSKYDTYNKAIKAAEKLNKEHPGYDTPGNLIRDKFGVKRIDEAIAKKLPVQHAVDAVHATLGPKSATRFLSHLSPGSDKHTSWDKVNDALVKQGVQTHHIASIAQKTSHMNEEVVDESRGHKVLATFFKNREVAQRAYQGNPAKDAEVAQGGGSPADQGIAAAKADYKKMNKEGVNPALMAILKKRQEAQKKKAEDKKKVNEAKTPAVHAAEPKKTKSTAKEYASASIPGTKRIAGSKSDNNEPGEQIKEDQYTSEYKIKQFVDPITGENKTRKIRPHRINFDASKMRGEPAQADAQGDYGIKEDGKVYDEKWTEYKGKTFKKESSC